MTFILSTACGLEQALASAGDSKESLLYYQGWAEGGNYEIVERKNCVVQSLNIVSCPITVKDDPMLALAVDFFVTDTFEITFEDRRVSSVETSSNDLPIYYQARDWVRANMPELVAQPCEGFFAGGATPGNCAQAMARGLSTLHCERCLFVLSVLTCWQLKMSPKR